MKVRELLHELSMMDPEAEVRYLKGPKKGGRVGSVYEGQTGLCVLADIGDAVFLDDLKPVGVSGVWVTRAKPIPPLGVVPRRVHDSQRVKDLAAGAVRFLEAGKRVPEEWVNELSDLCCEF